jgi:hypothetical protein
MVFGWWVLDMRKFRRRENGDGEMEVYGAVEK